jgi:Predicted permeases
MAAITWVSGALGRGLTLLLSLMSGLLGVDKTFLRSERYVGAIEFFFADAIVIFSMMAIITFIVAIVRSYFPPEKTRRLLSMRGKARGLLGNIAAALLGIVTPFCSCSAVPVFIGFIGAGIPLGVTFSFLISSPMVNEVALVMLWGLFGWRVALLYIVTGLTVAIISGAIIGRMKMERYLEDGIYGMNIGDTEGIKLSSRQRVFDSLKTVRGTLKSIWPHVLIGLALGAAMHGWAPGEWLARYAGKGNPFAVPLAVLVGIPLYSNAAGMLPVIRELTTMGVQMGTALAFLMAVTALSIPSLVILRRVLKPKLLALFIVIMAATITVVGYLFNIVIA